MAEESKSFEFPSVQEEFVGVIDGAKHKYKDPDTGEYKYKFIFFEIQAEFESELGVDSKMLAKRPVSGKELLIDNCRSLSFFGNAKCRENAHPNNFSFVNTELESLHPAGWFKSTPPFSSGVFQSIFYPLFSPEVDAPKFLRNASLDGLLMSEASKPSQRLLANIHEQTREYIASKLILLPPGALLDEDKNNIFRAILKKFKAENHESIILKSQGTRGSGNVFFKLGDDIERDIEKLELALSDIDLHTPILIETVSNIALLHQDEKNDKESEHADVYRIAFRSVKDDPDQFQAAIIKKYITKGVDSHKEAIHIDHYATQPPIRVVYGEDSKKDIILQPLDVAKAQANIELEKSKPELFAVFKNLITTLHNITLEDVINFYEQNDDLIVGNIEFLDTASKKYFVENLKVMVRDCQTVRDFFCFSMDSFKEREEKRSMLLRVSQLLPYFTANEDIREIVDRMLSGEITSELSTPEQEALQQFSNNIKKIVRGIFLGEIRFDPSAPYEEILQQFSAEGFIQASTPFIDNTSAAQTSLHNALPSSANAIGSSFFSLSQLNKLNTEALDYYSQGNYQAAIPRFILLVDKYSSNNKQGLCDALYHLGSSYLKTGQRNKAESYLEDALFLAEEISRNQGMLIDAKYKAEYEKSLDKRSCSMPMKSSCVLS